jgi:ATP diphosphatase
MKEIDQLASIMARLRDPENGCPWDLAQSFESLVPFTIEEAYEVAEAVERSDLDELRNELGDLLFQVIFYSQLAAEGGRFDFRDVVAGIVDKMIRRHPHVFAEASIGSAADQSVAWEHHKARERHAKALARGEAPSLLDGVSTALPALTRAGKLQRRAARVGFDWPAADAVADKVQEELREIRTALARGARQQQVAEEIGDLLFSCVNLARHLHVDPESALRAGNRKFERRFRRMEELLTASGRQADGASLEELDALWERVKTEESGTAAD